MSVIHVLPQAVISRIAAGEVVERPASVVKELVENALDAGAKTVHVNIGGGGRDWVRVSDDGRGMNSADLMLCVLPHATSKLTSADELSTLDTLGFRGEALPSIAAVSRFSITSQRNLPRISQPSAAHDPVWRIEIEGGHPERPVAHPASGSPGTTVEARELFFNLPVRAKFLKGHAAEAAACTDCLLRLALTRPDAGFSLTQDRQEIFSVLPFMDSSINNVDIPNGSSQCHVAPGLSLTSYLARARDVLGRSNSRGLLEVAIQGPAASVSRAAQMAGPVTSFEAPEGYRLFGLISPPAVSRPNRSCIYLNVNGRPVKDRLLTSALLEAYRLLLPPKRFPIAVLHLELPGTDVDINVHPTKAEVRFRLPGLVYALLHHAVRVSCGSPPQVLDQNHEPSGQAIPSHIPLGAPQPSFGQKAFNLWPRSDPLAFHETFPAATSRSQTASALMESSLPCNVAEDTSEFSAHSGMNVQNVPGPSQSSEFERVANIAPFRVLAQAGGSYIIIEDDTGVKLIDQHALHERVLFEELLARAAGNSRGDAQRLLIPETIELTPVQAAVFYQDTSAAEVLANIGFEVENFGSRTLAVRAVPTILKSAPANLVCDVLDALAETDDAQSSARKLRDRSHYREKAAYVLSCKGAIKAGERLSMEQMEALVLEYRKRVGSSGFTCPHGRPVAMEISWADLESAVGR